MRFHIISAFLFKQLPEAALKKLAFSDSFFRALKKTSYFFFFFFFFQTPSSRMTSSSLLLVVVLVALLATPTTSFWFKLPPDGEKCFYEEMVQDIFVGDTNADFSFAVRVSLLFYFFQHFLTRVFFSSTS